LGEHGAGIFEQRSSSVGQLDAARLAAKELHVEFAFEGLYLLTERRLLLPSRSAALVMWPSSATAMK